MAPSNSRNYRQIAFSASAKKYPEQFPDGQLRTLQRRVKEWRHIMAKKLVYACLDRNSQPPDISPIRKKQLYEK
jgi:hypothetical protein